MKKNRRAIQWLFEQLPGLVSGGVLSDESAQKLKGHYGEPAAEKRVPRLISRCESDLETVY